MCVVVVVVGGDDDDYDNVGCIFLLVFVLG